MSTVQTKQQVGVEDVQRALSDALGPKYRVTVESDSALKIGRAGVIPAKVEIGRANGMTTFKVRTTGLIVSRVLQAASINPRVRRGLEQAYPKASSTA
jgi:hypothetical protein